MKVLSVSTHCNIGGIPHYIVTLARALQGKGVDTVVATAGGELEGVMRESGITHRRIAIGTKCEFSPRVLIAAWQLRSVIMEEGIDIIHAHSRVAQVAALLASRMTGKPLVTTCHGYFKRRLRRVIDTWGERVIAISAAVRDHLRDDLGVAADRIALIYSGVDAARFSHDMTRAEITAARKTLGLGPGPVVGTIGRLSPVKGQKYLVEALARISAKRPDVQGLIVGDGPDREALEELARRRGIVDVARFIHAHVETEKLLPLMDVFVFPSVKEGLGIALLEALAAGRPCVVSDIGGIRDIVSEGETGQFVPVGDANAIARAVDGLLDDPDRRARMGSRGRQLIRERFTIDRMADETAALYRSVIEAVAKKGAA